MCMECGCRIEQAYERQRDLERSDALISPERRAKIVETIAELLCKIIEIGPGIDPAMLQQWRAQLKSFLALLGIDHDKHQWGILYGDIIWQVVRGKQFPNKPAGYPEFNIFSKKVGDLVKADYAGLGDLRGREGKALARYLYGLGFVLGSQLSYEFIFPDTDPIVVNEALGEILGRHRYLTLAVLEELGFDTSRWRWVHVEYQRGK